MSWLIAGKRISAGKSYRQASAQRYAAIRQEHSNRSAGARKGWQTWKRRAAGRIMADRLEAAA